MDFNRTFVTKSPEETAALACRFFQWVVSDKRGVPFTRPPIMCLYGELGSGKTTFVQGYARAMGITTRLLSPTFIIVRRYNIPSESHYLYHIDLYRLQGEQQLIDLGLADILADTRSFVFIEWADKLGNMLPKRRFDIHCGMSGDAGHTYRFVMHS